MDYNFYIDFASLFDDCFKECKSELEDGSEEWYKHILTFYQDVYKEGEFELLAEECDFTNDKILFVFGKEFNDKNESDPVGTSANVYITFDKKSEMFTEYEYEQG